MFLTKIISVVIQSSSNLKITEKIRKELEFR